MVSLTGNEFSFLVGSEIGPGNIQIFAVSFVRKIEEKSSFFFLVPHFPFVKEFLKHKKRRNKNKKKMKWREKKLRVKAR